jgi:hypothetical protein
MDPASEYILEANRVSAGAFINGPVWPDMKRAAMNRRPEAPDARDPSHIAAAKGHRRAGYEQCLADLEKLPFDVEVKAKNPFDSPALYEKD